MTTELKPGERLDDLQRNHLQIIQNPEKFCFGMDAVLLSGFAKVKPGEKVLDLGTGTGIIPILLSAKSQAGHLAGLEIQPESADMAKRSVLLNGLEQRIEIVEGDIKVASQIFGAAGFDVVTCNPPYRTSGCGVINEASAKAIARHEICCSLNDVIYTSAMLLKPLGKLFMIHRPDRLCDIMCSMRENKIEPKRIQLIYPKENSESNMVLIEGIKDGNPGLKILSPIIVHEDNGNYKPEIKRMFTSDNK